MQWSPMTLPAPWSCRNASVDSCCKWRWGSYGGENSVAIHLDDVKRCEKEEIVVVSTRCPQLLGLQRLVCHLKILVKLGGMLPVTTWQADLLQRVVRYLGNMSALGWWGMPWKVHHSCGSHAHPPLLHMSNDLKTIFISHDRTRKNISSCFWEIFRRIPSKLLVYAGCIYQHEATYQHLYQHHTHQRSTQEEKWVRDLWRTHATLCWWYK